MIVTIDTDQVLPQPHEPQIRCDTDQEYLQFVLSRAAQSYMLQYGTASRDEGITAARLAYNASIPEE